MATNYVKIDSRKEEPKLKNREKLKMIGFIKFLFVVAIFGIIAVVAIPNVVNFIDMAKSQAESIQLDNVQTVATDYLQDKVSALLDNSH